uniref:IQ domain-containing protein F3 n=1 Tax=Jaculus jaculus TaxID=51337 RepID=UPI0003334538|nr:IQ domain-containing protein F3 [Jaculus jaculus]
MEKWLTPGALQKCDEMKLEKKRQKKLTLAIRACQRRFRAARRIQAWWRGLLVRRALLAAALRAWVIQSWWRAILHRHVRKQRLALLRAYAIEEEAAVKLQACVRGWQSRHCFYRTSGALCVFQPSYQDSLAFQNGHILQVQYRVVPKQPEFHIEILSI